MAPPMADKVCEFISNPIPLAYVECGVSREAQSGGYEKA